MTSGSLFACAALVAIALPAIAQQAAQPPVTTMPAAAPAISQPIAGPGVLITPFNGQSVEQAQLDNAQCQNAATQVTGYVPGMAAPTTSSTPQVGGRATGAAKGAAVGAIVGEVQGDRYDRVPDAVQDEVQGNKAAAGATAGMVAGGMNQRQDRRQSRAEQEKAAKAQEQQATAWHNSFAGCIQARGYGIS